jgi:protein-disulfide isomerase
VFAEPPANPQAKDVVAIAGQAGLDTAAFEKCLNSPLPKERVTAEIAEGRKGQVNGTPTLFINGKRLPRLNDFSPTVEREAKRLGLPPLPPPPTAAAGAH